jgi:cysteine desulfurase
MKRIYLDNNSSTKVSKEVLDAMLPYFSENHGNPSSMHTMGQEANLAVQNAREQVAQVIGAEPQEIVFTSSGTESDNLALLGFAYANKTKGNHIITSSIEHPAILQTCEFLKKNGFEVTYLPVDQYGMVNPADVYVTVRPETILISVMTINNEIGTIQPIREIGRIAKAHDICFHTDAVGSIGQMHIDVKELGLDMLSMGSHKIHGPKGIGALYVKKDTKMQGLFHGGAQERNLRSGTENVPGIVGMGKACEVVLRDLYKNTAYMTRLRDRLIDRILEIEHVRLNGHRTKRAPNNVNVSFSFIDGKSLLTALDMAGIEGSRGCACLSKDSTASHVLLACG